MAVDVQKRNKRQYQWQKETSDRINFIMPKGYKTLINETAKSMDMNASGVIRAAIETKLTDCGVDIPKRLKELEGESQDVK